MKIKNKQKTEKRNLAFSSLLIILLIIFSMQFALALNDFDEYKPYLHKPSVGETPELQMYGNYETNLFPGAGTYSYSINVPRGTNGVQPSIILDYNSQSVTQRPGILGAGWSLSENYIKRHVNYTVEDGSDDYFILVLGGSSHKIFYNGSYFYTKIKSHLLIQNFSNNGKEYWIITDRSGNQYRFGYNNDSYLDSNTGKDYIVKWNLDQIEDTYENKIYYSYNKNPFNEDAGAIYLSNITYNNDELRLIEFDYEDSLRPDRRRVYDQGNELEESRRLENIKIYFNNSLVRRYSLNYFDLSSEKSLTGISNIVFYGADDSSILSNVSFEYYGEQKGFDNSTGKWEMDEEFSSKTSSKDYGIRLIDVNNDGFVDVVKARQEGSSKYTKLNNKNNTWNSTSNFLMPINIVRNIGGNNKDFDNGVRFGDVNKDGLVDFIHCLDSSGDVYINNGSQWNKDASWIVPSGIDCLEGTYNEKDTGVRLADVNGDGRVDLLKAKAGTARKIYLNNGTGWSEDTSLSLPDDFVKSDNKDNSLRPVDFNGDGLVDFVKGGEPGSAWINNGTGWESYNQYAPNLKFEDNDNNRPDLGVRFMDINGDNLVDMLQNFYSNVTIPHVNETCMNETNMTEENCTTYTYNVTYDSNTKINNGTGWILGAGWISPEEFTEEGHNIGRRIADVNGDGYADIVVAYNDGSLQKITHIRNATSSFLIKTIENTYGGNTGVEYNQSTLSNNSNLGFNLWVVEKVIMNNSLTNSFKVVGENSYNYYGGKFDYSEGEFNGFNIVNETLADNSLISHYFHQDEILRGKEYRTDIYDGSMNLYRTIFNFYSYSIDNEIFLNSSSSYVYDGDSLPFITNVSYGYDNYGNIKEVKDFGEINVSGDEKTEKYNFAYNVSENILNKISNYTLLNSQDEVVNRIWYYYDNLTSGVNKGDLTKTETYYDNGENPIIEYIYDSYGNQIELIDAKGYSTYYEYDDSTNSYVIKTTNELGHSINYEYNLSNGNLLSETRDGLTTSFEYDTFGRVVKDIISPDTSEFPTKKYTYDLDGIAPEMIKIEIKKNNSDYSEDIFVYDGFANSIQTRSKFDNGAQIVKNYYYDDKFRIHEIQNPYFDNYSSNLTNPLDGTKRRYEYDTLDRVINITKQDNSSIVIEFNKTTITQYDENNNRIDYILDSHDRIINVLEYNDAETYTTNYSYRTDNVLVNITDEEGNLFLFEYDSLGRKTSFDDPNINFWTYEYDLNGNIVNQTDGRNITTSLVYDGLNRMISKTSGNSSITFSYDDQYNGTLSEITFIGEFFNESKLDYSYDNRLRIIEEQLNISGELINTSVDYDSSDNILERYLPSTTLSYDYNKIGRIKSIQGYVDEINFNAFGSITNKTYSNNEISKFNYNTLNRITQIQTGSLQNLLYDYDSIGNVKSMNDSINDKLYAMNYDSLNRLINTTINGDTFEYNYSAIANTLSYNTEEKNVSFEYDNLAHAPSNVSGLYESDLNITLIWPEDNEYVNSDILQNVTFNTTEDSLCWFYIEYNNGTNISIEEGFSKSVRANGNFTFNTSIYWRDDIEYTWNITCYDYYGISDSKSQKFTVDTPEIRICRELTVDNRHNYTLLNNVSSNGTCFNITANNITIDGGGYTIDYAKTLDGKGIYNQWYNHTTIKNLSLVLDRSGLSGAAYSHGVNLRDGRYHNITDLKILTQGQTYGTGRCHGIYFDDVSYSNISNVLVDTSNTYRSNGIYVYADFSNQRYNRINNTSAHAYGGASSGINIYGVNNGGVKDVLIENTYSYSEDWHSVSIESGMWGSGDTTIYNSSFISESDKYGLYLNDAENTFIKDSNFSSIDSYDVVSTDNDHVFLNVSYSDESVTGGNLTRAWYVNVKVNDTNGTNVYQANVSGGDVFGSLDFSELTDSNGEIPTQGLVEYINDAGSKTYYSNYTVNVTKTSYYNPQSQSFNLTTNTNLVFTLDNETNPVINLDLIYPITNINVTQNEFFNITINITCLNQDCGDINISLDPKRVNSTKDVNQSFNDSELINSSNNNLTSNFTEEQSNETIEIINESLDELPNETIIEENQSEVLDNNESLNKIIENQTENKTSETSFENLNNTKSNESIVDDNETTELQKEIIKEEKRKISYTPTTKTTCENGKCKQIIYNSIKYVYEDGMWKDIKDVRSLLNSGFNIEFLEIDSKYDLEILDFNYTSVTVLLKSTETNKNIPFKIWSVNNSKLNKIQELKSIKKDYKDISDIKVDSRQNFKNKDETIIKTYDYKIGNIIEFGPNSTTLIISSFAADVYYVASFTYKGFLSRFDISSVPSGQDITSVKFCSELASYSGTDDDVRIWRFDNQTWTESITAAVVEAGTYDTQTTDTINSTTVGTLSCFNISSQFNVEYDTNTYLSIRVDDPDGSSTLSDVLVYDVNKLIIGGGGTNTFFCDSEGTDSCSPLPHVEVNYEGGSSGPSITLNNPQNDTFYSTEDNVDFNGSVYTTSNTLENVTFYWDVSGSFIANGTNSSGTNNTDYIFNRDVNTFGDFNWNLYACDNESNCGFADSNYTFSYHDYEINITDPTTSNPKSVDSGDNISIIFEFLKDGSNITSDVTLNNITIGGSEAEILGSNFCNGTASACSTWTNETACDWDSGCTWGSGESTNDTNRTCTSSFGADCSLWPASSEGDNTFDECDSSNGGAADEHVDEVHANGTVFAIGDSVLLTCDFDPYSSGTELYLWVKYPNGTWENQDITLHAPNGNPVSYSSTFTSTDASGEYIARCIVDWDGTGSSCESGNYIDHDDLNFSVVAAESCSGTADSCSVYNYSQTNCERVSCDYNIGQQFQWLNGAGWQANVTVPTKSSGTYDLFINATYEEETLNDTQTNAVNYSGAGDTTPPTYSNADHNQTTAGEPILFSLYLDDNNALNPNGQYIFSTNNTGVWVNDSAVNFTATPNWANVSKVLNSTEDLVVGYKWYLTDNAGNSNNTAIYTLKIVEAETEFKSGLISTIEGTTPFYTNASTNPLTINLNESDSQLVTFWVNATGSIDSSHEFFVFANLTSNMSISDITNKWNVTIM